VTGQKRNVQKFLEGYRERKKDMGIQAVLEKKCMCVRRFFTAVREEKGPAKVTMKKRQSSNRCVESPSLRQTGD